jgi:hypothetical protein
MYDIYSTYNTAKNYAHEQLRQMTLYHVLSLLILTILTSIIIRIRLLKWIYVGTMTVIITSLYNTGQRMKAAEEVFKLVTI